jgi:hypothetical protein
VDLYGQILGGYVPPLGVADVPPELASLREGLLRAEPRQRIPTAARALEYLGAWAGYRNAAGELGALCRATIGVVAPRSGIESAPTQGSVDPHAATQTPSTATRDLGGATHTSGRTSGAEPAATRISGAVPIAGPRPRSSMATQAVAPHGLVRRRALLVGAGIVGVGFSVGGIAVAWLRGSDRDGRHDDAVAAGEPVTGVEVAGPGVAAQGGQGGAEVGPERASADATASADPPAADASASADAKASADPPAADASALADAKDSADPPAADASGSTGSPATDGTTDASGRDDTTGEPAEALAAHEPRKKPTAPASVELRLRAPLRVAYVRIGRGPSFAVDPKAQRSVVAGRSSIWWRDSPDAAWRDGGRFSFEAGRHYTVRLTASGPVLE